ncbi:uncharacterized protein LOC104863054 [Fukomys damarensis]|uniref:uncharacterized protein LOC104863054 n=1 Tax=Fukomys damarensis TaxID=885580 RepID=UPI0014550037|nr:uncharacterized protein LOC104863054 [Fukomys damarensis]
MTVIVFFIDSSMGSGNVIFPEDDSLLGRAKSSPQVLSNAFLFLILTQERVLGLFLQVLGGGTREPLGLQSLRSVQLGQATENCMLLCLLPQPPSRPEESERRLCRRFLSGRRWEARGKGWKGALLWVRETLKPAHSTVKVWSRSLARTQQDPGSHLLFLALILSKSALQHLPEKPERVDTWIQMLSDFRENDLSPCSPCPTSSKGKYIGGQAPGYLAWSSYGSSLYLSNTLQSLFPVNSSFLDHEV